MTLKDVAGWEPLDLAHFQSESAFMQSFHETTRCLDSYLNGRHHRQDNPQFMGDPPDNQYYKRNAQLASAADSYHRLANDADPNVAIASVAGILVTGGADVDPARYAYDRRRMQEELTYRKAIKAELDGLGDNIPRLNAIAGSR